MWNFILSYGDIFDDIPGKSDRFGRKFALIVNIRFNYWYTCFKRESFATHRGFWVIDNEY